MLPAAHLPAYFFSPVVAGVEWLLTCPDIGIADDSCALLNSVGVACVGPLASPLFDEPELAGFMAASEDGRALGEAAIDSLADAPFDDTGLGGSDAFLQPSSNSASTAGATKVMMLECMSTS